jgi:hypothetical protein
VPTQSATMRVKSRSPRDIARNPTPIRSIKTHPSHTWS